MQKLFCETSTDSSETCGKLNEFVDPRSDSSETSQVMDEFVDKFFVEELETEDDPPVFGGSVHVFKVVFVTVGNGELKTEDGSCEGLLPPPSSNLSSSNKSSTPRTHSTPVDFTFLSLERLKSFLFPRK